MSAVTLEQVQALVLQLPFNVRLQLAAWICLREAQAMRGDSPQDDAWGGRLRQKEAEAFLAMVDAASELSECEFNAAAEIRRMREERDEQICPSLRKTHRRKPRQ